MLEATPIEAEGSDATRLRHELDARDKVIRVLVARVAAFQARWPSDVTSQNAALVKVVERKTAELQAQRLQLEDALQRLQRSQAEVLHEQKLTAIGQLAAGIAHEINTPAQYVADNTQFVKTSCQRVATALLWCIEAVRGLAAGGDPARTSAEMERMLGRGKLDYLIKETPKAIDQSLEGIGRIASIVSAMKSFSHPSSGVREAIDLNEAVLTTVTVARNEWKYVAEMVTDLAPDLPPVACLRDELNQVVLNLIVNAAHAIDAKGAGQGTIHVATRVVGTQVEIRVGDTGTGIPDAIRNRVFEPFFTTKTVGKGTGQGLHIAYQVIVDKHRGSISFDSEPGVGTTFIVRLPLDADAGVP
jgi:two-component system NtrC family sensor kinase